MAFILVMGLVTLLAWGSRQMAAPCTPGEHIPLCASPHVCPAHRAQDGCSAYSLTRLYVHLRTQWYILFNVIAGAAAIPTDLREAAQNLGLSGWRFWKRLLLPAIIPSLLTGLVTASGGTWNASIVAEVVSWGSTTLTVTGLGSYIAQWTEKGDYASGLRVRLSHTLSVIQTNKQENIMGWSAKDEMDFLENIGMHMTSSPHLNRKQSMEDQDNSTIQMLRHKVRLLGNYIKASELRKDWGGIDAATVIAFAKSKHSRLTKSLPYSG